jgi:SnoaL-like domain
MLSEVEFLKHLYSDFNARKMESVLAAMHPDVVWANGMEGGYIHGRDGVREYWTRQWAMIDPHVEPTGFAVSGPDVIEVEVHQIVRDLEGNTVADKMVVHVFRSEDGLIRNFDIR